MTKQAAACLLVWTGFWQHLRHHEDVYRPPNEVEPPRDNTFADLKLMHTLAEADGLITDAEDHFTGTEFDCKEGLDNWYVEWSKAKKEWCCQKSSIGCQVG